MNPAAGAPTTRPAPVRATATPDWRRSRGFTAGAVVAVALLASGLLLSRVDLALLALPLLIALASCARGAPVPGEPVAVELTTEPTGTTGGDIGYALAVEAGDSVEAIVLRLTLLGGEAHELVISGGQPEITGRLPVCHSGPQELLAVDYRLLGVDAAAASRPLGPVICSRILSPSTSTIGRLPLPRRLLGLTGPHDSTRAGDGGEFRDVHLFTAGDRLRRIDWRATARHAQSAADLYVRRTDALADATVLIVIDTRDDVGEQVAQWDANRADLKGTSVLDIARAAAASLAEGYIRAGDRVGFQDLCNAHRMIPHAGGGRHLWRLLRAIEATGPVGAAFGQLRPGSAPSGALIYLLSALLDDEPVGPALRWRGRGHRVIAVDVLPAPRMHATTRHERVAHRILEMERADRIRTLQAGGVELLRWAPDDAAAGREAQLQRLLRASSPGEARR